MPSPFSLGTVGCGGTCGCQTGCPLECNGCCIPEGAFVTWANTISGPSAASLTYVGGATFDSGCIAIGGLTGYYRILLTCDAGALKLTVSRYSDSGCTTLVASCNSSAANPNRLIFQAASFTCDPLFARYTLSAVSCPGISGQGFTAFTVSF